MTLPSPAGLSLMPLKGVFWDRPLAAAGFREKITGPVFYNAAVSPSQSGMTRAARASPLPLRSRRGRSGSPRNQQQRRQAAAQDRIFALALLWQILSGLGISGIVVGVHAAFERLGIG